MRFEVGRINHQRLCFAALLRQRFENACEYPKPRPPDPTVVKRLRRTVIHWSIPPAQTVTINEDDPAQNLPVITRGLPCVLGKKGRSRAICLSVSQNKSLISMLLLKRIDSQ